MRFLAESEEPRSATGLANLLSRELGCSRSVLFDALRLLGRIGIVNVEAGSPVTLTSVGVLITQGGDCYGKEK